MESKLFEQILNSYKDLATVFYEITESLNEYTSILRDFMDLKLLDPSNNFSRITESFESVSEKFKRCIDSIKFNIDLVKECLEEGYPAEKLKESNYNMILLSGAYSDANNSYSWMKEPYKSQVTLYQDEVINLIEELEIIIKQHNENHSEKIYTMIEALEIYKEGPLEYQRETFKDK
jgi:hypothetical protein